jgi:hypothetical protein
MAMQSLEALADDDRRPYAATANVLGVLDRIRRINLPDVIDNNVLRVTGVPEGARGRVAFALQFLRLVDAAARPTDTLRSIARASEDEFRELLAAVVRDAYAADFAQVDPAQDTQVRIISAFQQYEPRSQTMRMAMLFTGLCRAAGIPLLDVPRQRAMRAPATTRSGERRPPAERGSGATPNRLPQAPAITSQSVTITLADLALIENQEEFDKAWIALGVVTRAATRARQRPVPTGDEESPGRNEQAPRL